MDSFFRWNVSGLSMETSNPLDKSLWTLPGAVVEQHRVISGKRYGPYWSRIWREGGRLRNEYVPSDRLADVKAACDRYRRDRQTSRLRRDEALGIYRNVAGLLKQLGQERQGVAAK